MNTIAVRIRRVIKTLAHRQARARTRRQLLRYDERELTSMGFSRELLLQGVQAWPWRQPKENGFRRAPKAQVRHNSLTSAIAELNAYSDAELADLGIARGGIEYAVRYGRPGFPEHEQ